MSLTSIFILNVHWISPLSPFRSLDKHSLFVCHILLKDTHSFNRWRQTFQAGVKRGKHLLLALKVNTLQPRVSNAVMPIISRGHGKKEQRTTIFQHPQLHPPSSCSGNIMILQPFSQVPNAT